jgi:hypothetical protein
MPTFGTPAFVLPTGSNTAHVDFSTGGTVNNVSGIPFVSGVSTLLRMNNATDTTLTGVSGGVDGAILTVVRLGAGNVNFPHQSASSAAANQFFNVVTSGATSISTGGTATYVYDSASQRWRLTAHTQGAWITPSTPTFGGNGAMTWTGVTAPNTPLYCLNGRVLHWVFDYSGTVGGTPNTSLTITLPTGFVGGSSQMFTMVTNLTSGLTAFVSCGAAGTTININPSNTPASPATWGAGSARVLGSVTIEVS